MWSDLVDPLAQLVLAVLAGYALIVFAVGYATGQENKYKTKEKETDYDHHANS
jgi:hypothetical protein